MYKSLYLAEAQLQVTRLLICADTLKEYDANWLKSTNKVVRDSSGRFASQGTKLANALKPYFEISNWLSEVVPDFENIPGKDQAKRLLDEVKSGIEAIKAASSVEDIQAIASQVLEKGVPAATYLATAIGPDVIIGLTLGESLPIILGGAAVFAAAAKGADEIIKVADVNHELDNPWVKASVNLAIALVTADLVKGLAKVVAVKRFGATGIYSLTQAGKTADDLKATFKSVRSELDVLAQPAKTLLEQQRRDRFFHSLSLTSETSDKSMGKFFKNLATYAGGVALRSKLKVSVVQEGKGLRHDIHLDGKNVGYAFVENQGDRYWLGSLEVHPDYQGNGLGSFLLEEVIKKYKDKPIELKANAFQDKGLANNKLVEFYTKRGFLITNKTIDGVLMRLDKTRPLSIIPTPDKNLARHIETELKGLDNDLIRAGVNAKALSQRLAEMSDLSKVPLLQRSKRIADVKNLVKRAKELPQALRDTASPEIKAIEAEIEDISAKFMKRYQEGEDAYKIFDDLNWLETRPKVDRANTLALGAKWRSVLLNAEINNGKQLDNFMYGLSEKPKDLKKRYEAFIGSLVKKRRKKLTMKFATDEEFLKYKTGDTLPGEEFMWEPWASQEVRDKVTRQSGKAVELFSRLSPKDLDIRIGSLGNRAFHVDNLINVSVGDGPSIWHELTHEVEDLLQNGLSSAFRGARVLKPGLDDLARIGLPGEKAIFDSFFHPYCGKVYLSDATEILTTAMEQVSTAQGLHALGHVDREHLMFTLGVFRNA